MNPNQPKPTARERMEQTMRAVRKIDIIADAGMRETALHLEAELLGIDPNEFRRLLPADQPPN